MSKSIKLPEREVDPSGLPPGVSKFSGFYELFCRIFLSNQGVPSPANQSFGHVSVSLLGQSPRADGLFFADIWGLRS